MTTNDDYVSNQIAFLSLEKRLGIQIVRAENTTDGEVDLPAFERLIVETQPKLIAVTHIPTSSGLIQPVEAIGVLCKKYETLYLLDACQSIGQLVVDVEKISCDFLTATGRKFIRGPRGTGFLYVSDQVLASELEPLFLDSQGAEWVAPNTYVPKKSARRFELWERSFADVLGLKEAVRYANEIGMSNIQNYNQTLMERLRSNLSQIKNIRLLDRGKQLCNILTFHVTGKEELEMVQALKEQNVAHSVTNKSSAMFDFEEKGVEWAIRFSPHYFNTLEEMDRAANIVEKIVR